jgi:hypothetical protein
MCTFDLIIQSIYTVAFLVCYLKVYHCGSSCSRFILITVDILRCNRGGNVVNQTNFAKKGIFDVLMHVPPMIILITFIVFIISFLLDLQNLTYVNLITGYQWAPLRVRICVCMHVCMYVCG